MIRWIQAKTWQSSALIALACFLFLGGVDLIIQGPTVLLLTLSLSLAAFFAANIPVVSLVAFAVAFGLQFSFSFDAGFSAVAAILTVSLLAAFAPQRWRLTGLGLSVSVGSLVAWQYAFGADLRVAQFGLAIVSEDGRAAALLIAVALVLFSNALAWIAGRLVITRVKYVGTDLDQLVSEEQRAKLALEVAEQNERFEIARDINELIIQKISAVISQAEGGLYAAKSDPSSALRSLERIGQSSRAAHTELRRLYDMLNKTHEVSAAPPGLAELETLVVLYRELGFNASLRNEGAPFPLNEGAQLAIYRVIFDALENVKEHCLVGTDVSIDFSWVADGMQVLVKDNGIEVANRSVAALTGEIQEYNSEEDLNALVRPIVGPGITAMRERAALYGGSVEATRVPGVGFTISAIFPSLRTNASDTV